MNITIIVCTYNRCQTVIKALDSIAVQNVPESVEWDCLIVDNNSTDRTRDVMEKYCHQNPTRFSYVFEPKQGLSNARNAGVQNARGAILAFTDDDAVVAPDWIWNLTSSLDGKEWAGAGGRIIPVWQGSLPVWLSKDDLNTIGPFGGFDQGPEAGPLKLPFYGGNMAIRREAFGKYGLFRVDLGRSNTNLMGREDVEIANRMLAAGEQLRYEPHAVIWHPIAESRMKKSYVLRWTYWQSQSEIADLGPHETGWSIMGIPLAMFRRLIRWALQSMISTSAQKRFHCQRNVWHLAGSIAAYYHGLGRQDTGTRANAQASVE